MGAPILDEAAIFNVARQMQEPEARRHYLDAVCTNDQQLLARIEALLRVDDLEQSFLETPVVPMPARTATIVREGPGTQIGLYKLVEQIGEGGFGVVFLAEQQQPIRRTVALKILKPGMDDRDVVARFQAERQALALMDHVNIARMVDGGETASGRPYFVMELVKGMPITRYCDEQQLALRERLRLFVSVCHAVQHAHQKGIIHRDLKPTNVLVACYDGDAVAKVIDFGVAKALGERLTERTLNTGLCFVGTLEYMSPEAAEFARDIDTRADIYSLGVLLYELLTATTPLTSERMLQAGMLEILRAIRDEEPPKPSARLSALKHSLAPIAAQRKLEPALLTRMLRGELDWIVMKALDKDPNRRYATANGMARDIEHYLQNEPVEACPPSARYKLRKFAGKNRKLLGAAAAFTLLLTAGIIVSTWLAVRALQAEQAASDNATLAREALAAEAQRRRQARDALEMLTSQVIDEWLARQQELLPEHRAFLVKTLGAYEELARDTGEEEASRAGVALALQRVGNIRRKLGQMADAEAAYRRSRELYQTLVADFPSMPGYRLELGTSHANLGLILWETDRVRDAENAYRVALTLQQHLAADFPSVPRYRHRLADTHMRLGNLLLKIGQAQSAEYGYREALRIQRQLASEFAATPVSRKQLAAIHDNLGNLLSNTNRVRDAEDAYRQALGLQQHLAADFPTVPLYRHGLAGTHSNLGNLLRNAGRTQDAEQSYREALKLEQQLSADFPTVPAYRERLATVHNNLGNLLRGTRRTQDAEQSYREALKLQQQLAADFPTIPAYRQMLALVYNNRGNLLWNTPQDAEDAYRKALKLRQQLATNFPNVPRYRYDLADSHSCLGRLLWCSRRVQDAEGAYHDAIKVYQQLTADFPDVPDYRNELAGTMVNLASLLRSSKPGMARQLLEEAEPHHRAALRAKPRDPNYRQFFRNNRWWLGQTLVDLGDHAAAADVAAQLTQAAVDQRVDVYNAACIWARCADLAGRDPRLSEAQRQERAKAPGDRAMAALRQVVQNGYEDVAHMKKDSDLDALRPRSDFQRLLAEMEATAPSASK
jgi:serine/threonine protein kinase/tetratricopeptide (TPR) repeat protein